MKHPLLALLFLPALLTAQSDSTRTDTLLPVTVTATRLPVPANRTPLAVTVLEGDQIRRAQPQLTLQESLAAVPGVFVLNDANFSQDLRIAVRGFGARAAFGIRGLKILLDGIPESAPDGQAQVDNLDMATISSIEVLRGASGGLYGNASGGVISLTSDPAPAKPEARARLAGGSFGFRQLHASGGTAFKNSGFRAAFTHVGLDGFRAHAALRTTLANGQWHWKPESATQFRVLLNYTNSPRADDPGALTAAQVETSRSAANPANIRFDAGESVQQGRVGVVFEKKWSKQRELRLRSYSTWRDFENRLAFQNGGQVAFQRWFAGGGGQYAWALERWRFTAGFDLDRQTDRRQRFDNLDGQRGNQNLDQRETFTGAGAYALAEWRPAPAWTISGGARLDAVQLEVTDFFETDGDQSGWSAYRRGSPWGGVVARLGPRLQVYANGTTNFETPTLNELSNNPTGAGGFNADLKPQRTVSAEAGLRGQWPAGLAWEVALFRARTRAELVPYELPGMPGRVFYRNSGEVLRQGAELALRYRPLPGLDLALTYTCADFRYEKYETPAADFSGKYLPGLPQQWGMLEARYAPSGGLFAQIQTRYTGRFFAEDANAQAVTAYILVNARIGYKRRFAFGDVDVFLGSDNAVGTRYFNNIRLNAAAGRYFEPGAGRVFFGGVEVGIGK
jgi:iron complex outermembrane receptor protein